MVLILNNAASAKSVTLPSGSWKIVSNGEKAGLNSLGSASGTYSVPGYGSAVLVQGNLANQNSFLDNVLELLRNMLRH